MNNQTKNPLLAFGTPARVVINGEQITHPQAIDAYINAIAENPEYIRAIAFRIIEGVVKIFVKTPDGGITAPAPSPAVTHALTIDELKNSITEIARSERRDIKSFTTRELLDSAANVLDIMQDFDESPYNRGQRKRLQNFIAKWKRSAL